MDFVLNKGATKLYIQSALTMDSEEKKRQELKPLNTINDHFKKVVITKTRAKSWTDETGIIHLGLYEFLTDRNLIPRKIPWQIYWESGRSSPVSLFSSILVIIASDSALLQGQLVEGSAKPLLMKRARIAW